MPSEKGVNITSFHTYEEREYCNKCFYIANEWIGINLKSGKYYKVEITGPKTSKIYEEMLILLTL